MQIEELDFSGGAAVRFPGDFLWGVSEAAYAIEGCEGGRGECIWDGFAAPSGQAGAGRGCDHVNRFEEDLDLAERLGASAYHFSVSWPRVFPSGKGKLNREGVVFYEKLLDGLEDRAIMPVATLYYRDLPLELYRRGGWLNPDMVFYFGDYVLKCMELFEGRVQMVLPVHDPWSEAFYGYYTGAYAPGVRDPESAWRVFHHLLRASAHAAELIRESGAEEVKIGLNVRHVPVYRGGEDAPGFDHSRAQTMYDAFLNRSVLDPVFRGEYPPEVLERFDAYLPDGAPGEMKELRWTPDFVGLNYDTCCRVKATGGAGPLTLEELPGWGEKTAAGVEIHPEGLRESVLRLHRDYGVESIYITENGGAFEDEASGEKGERRGEVKQDPGRISFLIRHLHALSDALYDGAPVKGYFHWSLLDGFQWNYGFEAKTGLVHVDVNGSCRRTPRASFELFKRVIEENAAPGWGE